MDVHATLDAPCTPDRLFGFVDDLAQYPAWMPLAHRVEPFQVAGGPPAWQVELRAQLGPLARSKRLRMERTLHDEVGHRVVFERAESDGRRHSPWVLRASVEPRGQECTLHMHLHYGGALWTGGVLERTLADQITSGRERLVALVAAPTH